MWSLRSVRTNRQRHQTVFRKTNLLKYERIRMMPALLSRVEWALTLDTKFLKAETKSWISWMIHVIFRWKGGAGFVLELRNLSRNENDYRGDKVNTPPLSVPDFHIFSYFLNSPTFQNILKLLVINFSRFQNFRDHFFELVLDHEMPVFPRKTSQNPIFFGALRAPKFSMPLTFQFFENRKFFSLLNFPRFQTNLGPLLLT